MGGRKGAKWVLVGCGVRGGAQRTRSGQTSPRPACAAHGPISRQVPPCRCARTPPPLRVRHPANRQRRGGAGVDPRLVAGAAGAELRETRSGQTSPVPRARRAAPSHGRRLHAAALALHRRCACDIPSHPPGHTPQDHPRACVLADVRAQVRSTQQPQEARLERPSSPPGPPRPSRPIVRSSEEGAAEGRRGTPAPPHHPRAHVRAHHTAAGSPPRATELALSEQARLVRAGPSRELRGAMSLVVRLFMVQSQN